jgi:hypothetical protein
VRLCTREPSSNRPLGHVEHERDLTHGQLVPVVQLERDLLIERKGLHGLEHAVTTLPRRQYLAHRHPEIGHRGLEGIEAPAVALMMPEMSQQHVPSHTEQVAGKRSLRVDAVTSVREGDEGLLHEVFGAVADLGGKEAVDTADVPGHEPGGGVLVPRLPGADQLRVMRFAVMHRVSSGRHAGPGTSYRARPGVASGSPSGDHAGCGTVGP